MSENPQFMNVPVEKIEEIGEDAFIARWREEVGATWIPDSKKPWVEKNILKPIHGRYLEMIRDLKKEHVDEKTLRDALEGLNMCLDNISRRLGATDVENIIQDLSEIERSAFRRYAKNEAFAYSHYAVAGLYEFTRDLLRKYA